MSCADIAGNSVPAAFTSRDCFDYWLIEKDRLALVVADVCGHGLAPALLMSSLHALLRAESHKKSDIVSMFSDMNWFMSERAARERFVTMLYAEIDTASHNPGRVHDQIVIEGRQADRNPTNETSSLNRIPVSNRPVICRRPLLPRMCKKLHSRRTP